MAVFDFSISCCRSTSQVCSYWKQVSTARAGYADPAALTDTARSRPRAFLHRLGRETNQGEVGIVIGDKYYGITEFDSE